MTPSSESFHAQWPCTSVIVLFSLIMNAVKTKQLPQYPHSILDASEKEVNRSKRSAERVSIGRYGTLPIGKFHIVPCRAPH